MSDVFDIKRFFRYLGRDLRIARCNCLLSLVVCACLPAIAYLFHVLSGLVFTGSVSDFSAAGKYFCMAVACFVVIITFPAKQYGRVTDKRYGSDFLMFPASTLEKFLSCIVVTCVVIPFLLCLVMFGLDSFMSLLAPKYGSAMLPGLADFFHRISDEMDNVLSVNLFPIFYLNWCESILCFLLGAIVFKKSKVAKTILALMGLSMVFSTAGVGALRFFDISSIDFSSLGDFADRLAGKNVQNVINAFIVLQFLIKFAVLDICIFFRFKTLKH